MGCRMHKSGRDCISGGSTERPRWAGLAGLTEDGSPRAGTSAAAQQSCGLEPPPRRTRSEGSKRGKPREGSRFRATAPAAKESCGQFSSFQSAPTQPSQMKCCCSNGGGVGLRRGQNNSMRRPVGGGLQRVPWRLPERSDFRTLRRRLCGKRPPRFGQHNVHVGRHKLTPATQSDLR